MEMPPAETALAETSAAEIAPAEASPAQIALAETSPAQIAPTETSPAQIASAETLSAEIPPAEMSPATPSDELVQWLCDTLDRACHLAPGSVTAGTAVLDLGLDSLTLVSVLTQTETAYRFELSPDETLTLLETTHVHALARALAAIIRDRGSSDAPG